MHILTLLPIFDIPLYGILVRMGGSLLTCGLMVYLGVGRVERKRPSRRREAHEAISFVKAQRPRA